MATKRKIMSMQDLTMDLLENYELVKAGKMEIAKARALLDTADKVVQGARTQLAYNAMMQEQVPIRFLKNTLPVTEKALGVKSKDKVNASAKPGVRGLAKANGATRNKKK